jgi:uncharacterized membrane protein
MKEAIIQAVSSLPPEVATLLLSAMPVTEMRVSLPLALTVFHLSFPTAITVSVLGNILPIPFLLWLLPPFIRLVEQRIPVLKRWMDRYFDYLKRKHARVDVVGGVALGFVTLLPLPGAGVWTGCLLAVLFGLRPRASVPALVGGVIIEAVIISLIVQGSLQALRFLI